MNSFLYLLLLFTVFSCEEKKQQSGEFTDKVLDFVLENRDDRAIELADLYDKFVRQIPEDKDEKLILTEKLQSRGFKVIDQNIKNFPLGGKRIVTQTLSNSDCECEVSKIYQSTSNISEYIVTERILCRNAGK